MQSELLALLCDHKEATSDDLIENYGSGHVIRSARALESKGLAKFVKTRNSFRPTKAGLKYLS